MYPPQYRLPPINPAAFGGLPQQGPQGGPPMSPPNNVGGPQAQPPMDMSKYFMGALSAIADAMPQPQMNVAAQPAPQPPVQQQQARMA